MIIKLAQRTIPLSPPDGFDIPSSLDTPNASESPYALTRIISLTIGVLTVIAFIWFVIQFFIAAIQIISSGGDKNALAQARSKLTTSIIGVVVVVSAIFLIQLVGAILGINILRSILDLAYYA